MIIIKQNQKLKQHWNNHQSYNYLNRASFFHARSYAVGDLPLSLHVRCSPISQKNGHVGAAREGLVVDVDGLAVLLSLEAVIGEFLQSVH